MVKRGLILTALTLLAVGPAAADDGFGKLTGTVVDAGGVAQMGATITVLSESPRQPLSAQFFSNERGRFSSDRLLPGLYSIRVTLAGFLPAVERHVRVDAAITTLLRIELGSVFSSIDQLRRRTDQTTEPDDWAWVLRTSAATRSILRWTQGEAVLEGEAPAAERSARNTPHARVELTAGARRPGSVSNIADAPSSAIAYDQSLGVHGRLLFAGQMSYEGSASAGLVTKWLPTGRAGTRETTMVLRQSNLGPGGDIFRGVRMSHSDQMMVGENLLLDYGAEYYLVSLGRSTSSLRPGLQATYRFSPDWKASFSAGSRPWSYSHQRDNVLQSVLEDLDAFPTVLVRDSNPVLEGGWHQEFSVERRLGRRASLLAGVFRDSSRHVAIFGRGAVNDPDALQDFYSDAFAYDGGSSSSYGSRAAYRQQLSDNTEVVLLYAWAAALSPGALTDALTLRDSLETQNHHSLATRVSTRLPRYGTRVAASYKWISGPVASRQDPFGESAYQVDPFLNFSVRQPLPRFFSAARIEALADFRNLLAQGYVPVNTVDGQTLLIPAFRTIRGGVSVQF